MAQLIYRVTGRRGEERVFQTFRNTDEGRKAAAVLAAQLDSARTVYDVRTRIGGRVVTRTFKRRKDADAYASTIEADKLRGVVMDPRRSTMTVAELAESWLASNPSKRADTRATDEYHLRAHILPPIGTHRAVSVTPAQLQVLVNDLATRLAPKTVARAYGVVRAMFTHAFATDVLARSPCRGVKLPRVDVKARKIPTPGEVIALADAMPDEYRAMVYLGAVLGLRFSEIAGLRVGRFDLLARSLLVAETLTRDGIGRPVFGPPKSAASRRTLAIPVPLVELLTAHLQLRGLTGADAEVLVFTAPDGGPLRYANWRSRVWSPACRAARVDGLGFHGLRRASATALVLEGVDLKTAQTRLGHSDSRLTLNLYAQAVADADRDAADRLAARFMDRPRDGRAMDRSRAKVPGP
jgi:integrase